MSKKRVVSYIDGTARILPRPILRVPNGGVATVKCRLAALLFMFVLNSAAPVFAQSFGVEVFNNLMPASGGMAGASIASPQDVQSAIYGNPATMTQYRGTQFGLGGAWIEPTYNLTVADPGLPFVGVGPVRQCEIRCPGHRSPEYWHYAGFQRRGTARDHRARA